MSPTEITQRIGFAPITRINTATREIEVTATSEALDAYGTIFDYDASRGAFERWLGNVREMHAPLAVGKRVAVTYDPELRQVRVRLRISRGAESTWQKIVDGTLCGASIGAANVTWRDIQRADLPEALRDQAPDTIRVATAYDLVELSLVDAPANPDCVGVAIVRAMTPDADLLDPLDDAPVDTIIDLPEEPPLHAGIRAMRAACGCADCREALTPVTRSAEAPVALAETRRIHATLAALHGAVERAAHAQERQLADLAARLERLEAQPLPGGPILRAAEKTLGGPGGRQFANVSERIAALQEFGGTHPDQHTQVAIAAEILRLQREG